MIEVVIPWIGACAAVLTSLSYIPQVRKAWPRGSTADLSLKMLTALTTGLLLWIVYGLLKSDWVIVAANCIGATLSGSVLAFKIRDMRSGRSAR
ncbi:MAG: MtN3 and saliva related transrane protein [Bradyrhizobium sp.]|jgi:MtN3 and saliva related transmembrane protein|nr:MtN3 and saliva related transrane protein [Bradyrhizobium sp.]